MSDKILEKIYYDPKREGSFSGAKALLEAAKAEIPNISLETVKDWLSSQVTYTLHKQARKRFPRNPVYVDSMDEQWQADLAFVEKYHRENGGYKYILTIIDILSKYAYAKPLKTKTPGEIKPILEKIFQERKPFKFQTDKGLEFDNRILKKFFKENEVNYFTTNSPEIKCSVVERFNRTLKNKIFKYFTANGTRKWAKNLDDIIEGYNKSYHRSIKMRPIDVTYENQHIAHKNLYEKIQKRKKILFKPGDTVRLQHKRGIMDRGFYPYWTDQTFEIDKLLKEREKSYKIKGDNKRKYYTEELQKVKPVIYRVEKVIRKKGRGSNEQFFVKWLGYDNSHNSWIPAGDLMRMYQTHA